MIDPTPCGPSYAALSHRIGQSTSETEISIRAAPFSNQNRHFVPSRQSLPPIHGTAVGINVRGVDDVRRVHADPPKIKCPVDAGDENDSGWTNSLNFGDEPRCPWQPFIGSNESGCGLHHVA